MNDERGNMYLLTGLVLGVILGVLYAWFVQPLQVTDISPAALSSEDKDRYRAMIASAYLANGDLVRARARLELLDDKNGFQALAEQAQRSLSQGNNPEEARALGLLAVALGNQAGDGGVVAPAVNPTSPPAGGASVDSTGDPGATATSPALTTIQPAVEPVLLSPTEAALPAATDPGTANPQASAAAPLPTRTASPTPGAPFVLDSQEEVCDPNLRDAAIQIRVLDAAGRPVPGVEILVTWDAGQERIFTGLKPELGLGYADFTLQEGLAYTVQLAGGGEPVTGLAVHECQAENGIQFWGGWMLVFVQP